MKTVQYLSIVTLAVFLAACGATSTDKQSQLEGLKKQQKEIADQIVALEKELAGTAGAAVAKPSKSKEVSTTELVAAPFNYFIQTQGGIEAEENILISAKTPGVVTAVYVKEGQSVAVGQVLAQVDNSLIVKGIEELKSGLELANTVYERQKSLWDQKIGTEIQYLTAKNNKESLEKKLATLNEQNEMSKIKSSINGTVEDVMAKVGENAAPGMPAFRVIGTSNLKVIAKVSEAYINQIKVGNKVSAKLLELGQTFESRVTFVGRNIDPLSRTFNIEIPVTGKVDVRPNMSATIQVTFNTIASALAVPVNVVQTINDEKVVYVAEEKNGQMIARRRVVQVGGVYNNQAEIKSGLKAGEKLITFGYQGLNDGELVKI
jgi:membrane fusion protein (multidrug efflux system)